MGKGSVINYYYYSMANPVLGKSLCSDWFFLGQDFAVWTVSMEMVQPMYFCFGVKPANSKFATKTAKKNCEYCHSSQGNYQKKPKRLKFFPNFKLSRMKGSVGLLSIAMRTIDFEAIFYQLCPVLN